MYAWSITRAFDYFDTRLHPHLYSLFLQGYYIYMESSYARKDMLARIRTQVMAATTGESSCLIMWYHMFGDGVGTLSVYMRNADELVTEDPLWSMSGNRGDRWWATEMDLESDKDFVVSSSLAASI